MRPIMKNAEPMLLARFRKNAPSFRYKDRLPKAEQTAIQEALCKEQGYVCAYCMQPISPDGMVVEHWYPECDPENRNDGSDMQYGNMLGSCKGMSGNFLHCDNFRGKTGKDKSGSAYGNNALLKYNPAAAPHHALLQIYYGTDGFIHSRDAEFDRQLETVLNLNNLCLVECRRKLQTDIATAINAVAKGKSISPKRLERMLENWREKDADGKHKKLYGVAIDFLEKRLRRG